VTYKIATVIDSSLIYPTRRGGDAYWKIKDYHLPGRAEASSSSASSNGPGELDKSHGKTKNYGVGVLGILSVGFS
ncbi:hypothetical protein S1OALGB6SA_1056, partial [Olavius algarvensis spirochete endosymbiont]|uniref:hypothetical protein n=1 Tax=Olavius algarvensis spirochete endosymbiont TaxID=260710 RepID=UPI000F24F04E